MQIGLTPESIAGMTTNGHSVAVETGTGIGMVPMIMLMLQKKPGPKSYQGLFAVLPRRSGSAVNNMLPVGQSWTKGFKELNE